MKLFRTPSLTKTLKARTTAKWKRQVKRQVIPFYGKRGMGWRNPKSAVYNRVYSRVTFDLFKWLRRKL